MLTYPLWQWLGEYYTKDIPYGVEVAKHTGAVYTVQADGSDLREIYSHPGADANIPTWRDGWITFQSNDTGRHHIYRCRPDGSQLTNLTEGDPVGAEWGEAYGFAFSADGRKMVYTVHNGRIGRAVLANADGSAARFVAPHLGYTYMAALSPNADRVVFSGPADGYRLKILELADDNLIDLTPDYPDSYVPQFTPDGATVVFFRRDGDVYRVDVATRRVERLTQGSGYTRFKLSAQDQHGSSDPPGISPDGARLAYIALKDGVQQVHTMNLDGSNQRQLTFRPTPCARVQWSPDGHTLAFVSFEGPYTQLFVMDADGGAPRQITNLNGAVYSLSWQQGEQA